MPKGFLIFPLKIEIRSDNKDEDVGPDLRPIMGAIVGPNIGLSEVGSMIVRKIGDNAEEVLNKIEMYSKERLENDLGQKKIVIASMDIEKFYNNILAERVPKKLEICGKNLN